LAWFQPKFEEERPFWELAGDIWLCLKEIVTFSLLIPSGEPSFGGRLASVGVLVQATAVK
jgi:hypothetical protein